MFAEHSSLASTSHGSDLTSSCAHRWTRHPDHDPSTYVLAFRCEACGAQGERPFGTNDEIRVVEPTARDYWHRGRVRTERDRLRSIHSQLDVDDLISGQPLTLAEVIRCRPKRRARIDRDS